MEIKKTSKEMDEKIVQDVQKFVDENFKPKVKITIDKETIMDLHNLHGLSADEIKKHIGDLVVNAIS